MYHHYIRHGLFVLSFLPCALAIAAPVITSPPPANGVSPSAPLVFTFSEPMNTDTDVTGVAFVDLSNPLVPLLTTDVWSGGDTILTCTPTPAFPANRQIVWSAYGENLVGDFLDGMTGGLFTTGSGSGSSGSGTNAITTFSVGKVHHYMQTSAVGPTPDPETPYGFSGVTSLSSNRTANSVTLALPTGAVSNLMQIPFQPEIYGLFSTYTAQSNYDAAFPAGNYSFTVSATASNQTVIVNLPTTNAMPQPNAPRVTNYVAAQAVDPTKPFVLGWDAFVGGSATNYIDVDIGSVYLSPDPGKPGALNGTARTFTIPAGTLQPNSNYLSRIGFFRRVGSTNAFQAMDAYRATYTEFSLITTAAGLLVLTNAAMSGGVFSFDVLCSTGQTVTVEYTNALTAINWTKLLTTNSPGSRFHVVSTQSLARPSLFYRARNGP